MWSFCQLINGVSKQSKHVCKIAVKNIWWKGNFHVWVCVCDGYVVYQKLFIGFLKSKLPPGNPWNRIWKEISMGNLFIWISVNNSMIIISLFHFLKLFAWWYLFIKCFIHLGKEEIYDHYQYYLQDPFQLSRFEEINVGRNVQMRSASNNNNSQMFTQHCAHCEELLTIIICRVICHLR